MSAWVTGCSPSSLARTPMRSQWCALVHSNYYSMTLCLGCPPSASKASLHLITKLSLCQRWGPFPLQSHSCGKDFRLGEQKLVKNNQDNQIQSITLCSIVFFEKCLLYNGVWGKAPEARNFRVFCVKKSNFTVCKFTSRMRKFCELRSLTSKGPCTNYITLKMTIFWPPPTLYNVI